jgi:hypothetical protein
MALNSIGSGQKAAQMAAISGSSSLGSAAVTAQIAAALANPAVAPTWLAKSPRPCDAVPIEFCRIYSQFLNYDGVSRL